jgi:hypothetical protein
VPSAAVTAAQRHACCLDLVNAGLTHDQIDRAVGYAHRGLVSKAADAVDGRTADAVDERTAPPSSTASQAAAWDKSLGGHIAVAPAVLRVIGRRCRLPGLDAHTAPSPAGGGSTVVDPVLWETRPVRASRTSYLLRTMWNGMVTRTRWPSRSIRRPSTSSCGTSVRISPRSHATGGGPDFE